MENREILSYFDILAFSRCILYFDILVVFRILILKFSRIRSQVHEAQGACCPDHDDEVCQGDRDFPSRGLGGGAAQGPTAPEGEEKREGGGGQGVAGRRRQAGCEGPRNNRAGLERRLNN